MSIVSVSTSDVKPPNYHELRHFKWFLLRVSGFVVMLVLVIVGLSWLLSTKYEFRLAGSGLIALITLPILAFQIYKQHWIWKHDDLSCSSDDGLLYMAEPTNRWLLRRGSDPDPISLATFSIETLRQSILETYVPWFYSAQTVVLTGEEKRIVLTDVVHAQGLVDIQKYIKGLNRRGIQQNDEIIGQNEVLISQNETIIAQLDRITTQNDRTNYLLEAIANGATQGSLSLQNTSTGIAKKSDDPDDTKDIPVVQ